MADNSFFPAKQHGQSTFDYELFEMDRSNRGPAIKSSSTGSLGLAPKILGVGICIMLVTVLGLSYGQNNNHDGPTPLLSKWLFADDVSQPPSPPDQLDAICSKYNVQFARGAAECAKVCAAARCCHHSCWHDNKGVCLRYHHHCSILDGVDHATGQNHDFLSKGDKNKWFGEVEGRMNHDDEDSSQNRKKWKNVFAKRDPRHVDDKKGCQSLDSNDSESLGSCIRQCLPATCCFLDAHSKPSVCSSLGRQKVTCSHYQQCKGLF
jgi:hypothetical protein